MKSYKATYENQNGEKKTITIEAINAQQGLMKGLALRKNGYDLLEIELDERNTDEKMAALFTELVPMNGKADSLAGEIVRATNRIAYRYNNDGDRIGIGYGKETTNAAARFLQEKTTSTISAIIGHMWGRGSDEEYEYNLGALIEETVAHIERNPELRDEPTEDMWDYTDKDEDRDDEDDDWDGEEY